MKRPHILFVFFAAANCSLAQIPAVPDAHRMEYQELMNIPDNAGSASHNSVSVEGQHTVSLKTLKHKVPSKALAAFSRALKLARSHQWQKGAEELEKAVAIDPEFSDAHGNLGVHYLALHRVKQATVELRRAIALDPNTSAYHSNMALAYVMLGQPALARSEAEIAVSLDSRNARGQYLLGFLLAKNPANLSEARKHLSFAADEIPDAHLELMALYGRAGEESKAKAELERYRKAIANNREDR